jgi:hypothetical protein
VQWDKDPKQEVSLKRLRAQMTSVCGKLPAGDPARASCDSVFRRNSA